MKDKETLWHRHIDKQAKSSLSIQSYCDRHKLSPGMFYYWKRKHTGISPREQFAEVQIVNQQALLPCAIHVQFPSGVEMWFDTGTEASFLRELARLVVSN